MNCQAVAFPTCKVGTIRQWTVDAVTTLGVAAAENNISTVLAKVQQVDSMFAAVQ